MAKRNLWEYDETLEMLNIIDKIGAVKEFSNKKCRKPEIFKRIESIMKINGFSRKDSNMIATRWKNLKKQYMAARKVNNKGGTGDAFPFYDEMERILCLPPSTKIKQSLSIDSENNFEMLENAIQFEDETLDSETYSDVASTYTPADTNVTPWSNEKTISFISSIHKRPVIWDVTADTYKDRYLKKEAWAEVARKFNISHDEAQKKFKNLRTYFKNEVKKLQAKHKGGSGGCTWFAFNEMSFLLKRDFIESEMDGNEDIISESDDAMETILRSVDHYESSIDSVTLTPHSAVKETKKRKYKQCQEVDKKMNESQHKVNKRNAFADHISQKLEYYNRYVRNQVEYKISQILYQADMGLFNEPNIEYDNVISPRQTGNKSPEIDVPN